MSVPRCIQCGYVLTGLPPGKCPGCDRPFNPNDLTSFSDKPLYNPLQFWLPGFLLAFGCGLVLYPVLIHFTGFGWTVTLLLPLCLGTIIGYGCRVMYFVQVLIALIVLAGAILGLAVHEIVGVYCGIVMAGVALGPLLLGTLFGAVLRMRLKQSAWGQRWYLPMVMLMIAPMVAGTIEAQYPVTYPDETVSTTLIMPVSVGRAWNAVMFYEEIHEPPPLLIRFALPRPLFTRGSVERVGDLKVCIYRRGRLVKRVAERIPNVILAFSLVEQRKIEVESVILKRGSFKFAPLSDTETSVTLTTTFQPLLGPRWCWRWAEHIGLTTLHEFVLNGMRHKAIADSQPQPAIVLRPPPRAGGL